MPRTHGYAPVGQRCYGRCDWHARGRINVIGAQIGQRRVTVGLFESTINADVFHAWTAQVLLPHLPPAAVIVMDNARFHTRRDIQDCIRKAGHTLEYLPPYSPDLNPIEHKGAQAKAIRKQSHCSVDALFSVDTI
jgi:transposase